jgi:hypothetical protein
MTGVLNLFKVENGCLIQPSLTTGNPDQVDTAARTGAGKAVFSKMKPTP